MDRRFFTFILASTAFFLVYASLRIMFVPPPLPQELIAKDADAVEPPLEDLLLNDEAPQDVTTDDPLEETIQRPSKRQWRTLGSMNADAGYMMLVTLSNVGSGVERIELTERKENGRLKYCRVDVHSGYLGYIAADEMATENGVRVNVVGPGTPVDLAKCVDESVSGGLQVDDLIVSLNDRPINNATEMYEQLEKSKPGDSITVGVNRNEKPLTFSVQLTEHPLDLVRLSNSGGFDEIPGNLSRLSCLISLAQLSGRPLGNEGALLGKADPAQLLWNLVEEDSQETNSDVQSAVYELRLSDSELKRAGGQELKFRRGYQLAPGSYLLDMNLELENASETAQSVAYRLEGVNGVTLEGWWYSNKISPKMFEGAAARDVVYRTPASGHQLISGYGLLKNARDETKAGGQSLFVPASTDTERQLEYIGVDTQYFTVAYVPPQGTEYLDDFGRATAGLAANPSLIPKHKERAVNPSFYLDSQLVEMAPGETIAQSLRIFAGPKQPALLDTVGMGEVVYYGWFSWPAKLLGHLLHFLSGVGNYAIAIVLLTVIVRAAMFPLSRKAAINAQRMQELAPELKKIAEKYKDDMEGRIRAQRELQQRVGFNPMAGCLPMLLQLPIFMGLYRTLSVDIELRQAAFASWTTWSSNLAAPDMLAYWGDWLWDYMSGRGTGWLGPYFNILPMIVVVLFLIQQKMFMPPATDEQTMLQQKMMNYMTLFMGLFFFRVPAGLCIYFITSSIWGISERIVVKRTLPSAPHFDPAVLEGKVISKGREGDQVGNALPGNGKTSSTALASTSKSSGESWTDKLRKRIVNEVPAATPPKDRKRPTVNKKRK